MYIFMSIFYRFLGHRCRNQKTTSDFALEQSRFQKQYRKLVDNKGNYYINENILFQPGNADKIKVAYPCPYCLRIIYRSTYTPNEVNRLAGAYRSCIRMPMGQGCSEDNIFGVVNLGNLFFYIYIRILILNGCKKCIDNNFD